MANIVRYAAMITGAFLLLLAAAAWIDPVKFAASLGVGPIAKLGQASLRADLGAFFGVCGAFALIGAARRSALLMATPLCLIVAALAGRIAALTVLGVDPVLLPPMVAEAVMAGIFAAAWRQFS